MCEPSLTLIWVLEYPLVTFLTLLITRDMMGGWVVSSGEDKISMGLGVRFLLGPRSKMTRKVGGCIQQQAFVRLVAVALTRGCGGSV